MTLIAVQVLGEETEKNDRRTAHKTKGNIRTVVRRVLVGGFVFLGSY